MFQRSASSSSAQPRFLLSLSASSTPSQQQLHGPANDATACWRLDSASPPDSACRSTSQEDIELVAIHHNTWDHPSRAPTPTRRVGKHQRASLSLPALSPSALPEGGKSAFAGDETLGLTSRGRSASLETPEDLTADLLGMGMTPIERQNKANQVWRGYW